MTRIAPLFTLLLLLAAVGCDDTSTAGGSLVQGDAGPGPAFAEVHAILRGRCAGCHGGESPAASLDLSDEDIAYAELVDAPAEGGPCGGFGDRVVPFDPDASILVSKVSDADPVCGARMPFGGAPLSAGAQDTIRAWVAGGAPR